MAGSCGGGDAPAADSASINPLFPPARDYWPTQGWQETEPERAGMDPEALQSAIDYAFEVTGDEVNRAGIRTDGLVIVRRGRIVAERYGRGYDRDVPHLTWSVTKSFMSALVGIAARDGEIDIDDPAGRYYEPLNKPDRSTIKIRDLLNMSSGLYWNESYETSPLKSSVIAMLYTRGHADMALFAAEKAVRAQPGTYVYYSSGDTNMLSAVLRGALGEERYANYPWEKLFGPIGMSEVTWERDKSGTFVGSSYLYCTPRDLAKFGFLFLNDGNWAGQEILTSDWVTFSRTPAPGYSSTPEYDGLADDNMTAQWYANTGIPHASIPAPWPDAPSDTFAALGHWGQQLYVIPSLDLVIVRTGDDRDGSFDKNEFLKRIANSVVEE